MARMGLAALATAAALTAAGPAAAQRFAGEVVISSSGGCPEGMLVANGAILPIQKEAPIKGEDYRELFRLYGTAYGGDGTTGFAIPDMRAQLFAFNDLARKRAPVVDEKQPPAMRVELPVIFCIVIRTTPAPH